jgi:tRNA threonylcarbamoyl adenosine modification protein YeaZ
MAVTPYILAIEAAIAGGSLSLCQGGSEIASWCGPTDVSRAEDLLINIDILLRETDLTKKDLGLIAVSSGPGSFTGIRIGIATALGFKNGLGIPMSSESALKAMVNGYISREEEYQQPIYAAVPSGRNAVCLQRFIFDNQAITPVDEPATIREEDFLSMESDGSTILVHSSLFERRSNVDFVDCGSNIARFIAEICRDHPGVVTPPLFISKSF